VAPPISLQLVSIIVGLPSCLLHLVTFSLRCKVVSFNFYRSSARGLRNHGLTVSSVVLSTCVHNYCTFDSAPSLGVYYFFLSLTPSMSVCHAPANRFFFFVSRWNRAFFWPSVLHVALYKTLFFDFSFRPPNPQNLLPKICHKIAYRSACMADRPETFRPTRGFSGMTDSMEPYKMLWVRPLLPWQRILR